MKKAALILSVIACLGVIYCTCSTSKPQEKTMDIQNNMKLIMEPDEHWQDKMKVFIFSVNKRPQLAVWIEDADGNYVSTIAVSGKSAKGNWTSAPKEGRPEALPVWNHRKENYSATGKLDAVSSATIKGSFETNIDKTLLVNGNTYNVFLEINHSFDYNDHWIKENSGVNGQPSLVYHAQFTAGQPFHIPLVPIGYGSVDGSHGNINSELASLTSALHIVKDVYITGEKLEN